MQNLCQEKSERKDLTNFCHRAKREYPQTNLKETMDFISLFSGIDGFDTGFERAGMECIGKVEMDRWCNAVSRYHSPKVKRLYDVKEVKRSTFPIPGLNCAGVPCQDVSIAGKRAGLDGERTGLFFEFSRIVKIFKPKWLVFENVPGLLSANERRDFARVLGELGQCGYFLAYRILDSQYWGVAQRRRRVFIVGSLGDGRSAEVLFERESLSRNPAKGRKTRKEKNLGTTLKIKIEMNAELLFSKSRGLWPGQKE